MELYLRQHTKCCKETKFKYENLGNKFDSKSSHGHWAQAHTNHATLAISEWPGGWIPAKNKLLKLLKGLLTALKGFKSCNSTSSRSPVKLFFYIGRSSVPPSSSIFLSDHVLPIDGSIDALLIVVAAAEVVGSVDSDVAALLLPCCCRCCHAWGHSHRNFLVVLHQVFQICVLLPSGVASCCIAGVLVSVSLSFRSGCWQWFVGGG